jgi:transposase
MYLHRQQHNRKCSQAGLIHVGRVGPRCSSVLRTKLLQSILYHQTTATYPYSRQNSRTEEKHKPAAAPDGKTQCATYIAK